MYFKPQTRRCMNCGNTFVHIPCDLVFKMFPKCPKCGSRFTIRIGKLM